MEHNKIKQILGLMVAFDFDKTFDSLGWSFLFQTLKSSNFGKSFISWVSVMSSNISNCILKGFSIQMFEVRKGVRRSVVGVPFHSCP